MTMTDVRPVAGDSAAELAPQTPESWFTSGDHKKLGLLYLGTALVFLIGGGVLAMLMRIRLAEPTSDLLGGRYGRVFSAHALVMTLLFLAPAWIGLGTYLVPLQIGSGRLAFPRLHAAAYWTYLVGGGLVVASYIAGPTVGIGITDPAPPLVVSPANQPTLLWISGLILLALSSIVASVSLLVTALGLRTEGMTFLRMPAFSWSIMLTSAVTLLSTPVFLAGLVILLLDERFGAGFFQAPGSEAVWLHTIWLFGRPEIFLLTLPGLGAACDIVATHAKRPLERHEIALGALAVFAVLSFTSWMAGPHVSTAVVLPTYTVATALIAAPVGVLALVWLNTIRLGKAPAHVSVLFVIGFILLLVTGAANAIGAAIDGIEHPSAWTTGNLHTVAFGAPTLLVFGAIYHWAPKLWGRKLSQALGTLTFLFLFGGLFINGMASYILGYQGAPSHVDSMDDTFQGMNRMAAAGGALVILGVFVFLLDILTHVIREAGDQAEDDPYDGLTLEWAAASPPVNYDFDTVPEVRSPAPLADVREAEGREVEFAGGSR